MNIRYITGITKCIAAVLIILITSGNNLYAQKGSAHMNINYSAAFPVGNFKNAIENNSFRGWQGSVLYGIKDRLFIGVGSGFQDFYRKIPRQVYKNSKGGDISAVMSRSIQAIPILAEAKYTFMSQSNIQPYIALGLGGNVVMDRNFLGEFGQSATSFRFAARPEAGIFVPFRKAGETGVTVGGNFNFMPYKSSDIKNLNSVGIFAGIRFPLRR